MWLVVVTSVYAVLRLTLTKRRLALGEVFNPVALADAPGGIMILGLIPLLRSFTPLLVLAGVWRIGALSVAVGSLGPINLGLRVAVVIVLLLAGLVAFGATGAILWSIFPGWTVTKSGPPDVWVAAPPALNSQPDSLSATTSTTGPPSLVVETIWMTGRLRVSRAASTTTPVRATMAGIPRARGRADANCPAHRIPPGCGRRSPEALSPPDRGEHMG